MAKKKKWVPFPKGLPSDERGWLARIRTVEKDHAKGKITWKEFKKRIGKLI